jgi:VWFA-related protein
MRTLATYTALALILGLIPTNVVAQGLIAMRVDVEPVRAVGELTAVSLVVQIAPEDRLRIGRDAWVKAVLRDADTVVDRFERAAAVDQQGIMRLEPVWTPGEYVLRVDVEGARGTGFWRGRISVPLMATAAERELAASLQATAEEEQPTVEPADRSGPVVELETAPEEAEEAVVDKQEVAETPTTTVEEVPVEEPVKAAAGVEAAAETESAAEPEAVEPVPEEEAEPKPVEELTAVEPTEPEPVEPVEPVEPAEPAPPVSPEPEQAEDQPDTESIQIGEEPAPVEPPTPTIEPVFREAEREADQGESMDPAIAYGRELGADLTELSFIVTERSRPVVGLLRSQLRLKVDGKETMIERLAGADEVPLSLGFAIDTSSSMETYRDALRGMLGRFSIKAAGDRGRFFVLTQGEETRLAVDWSTKPSEVNQVLAGAVQAGEASLAQMVTAAMEPFSGRRGRKVLLIVTDGGDTATRAEWKTVLEDAGAAGVTVFVIGFQSDSLTIRTRSSLERLATNTGGEYYFIPDTEMLKMVVDYYSGMIDGSFTIGFRAPQGKPGRAYRIRLEIAGRAYDVRYPQSLMQ